MSVGTVWCQTPRQHISEAWGLLVSILSPQSPRNNEYISAPVWNCAMLTPSVGKERNWNIVRFLQKKKRFKTSQRPTGAVRHSCPPTSLELLVSKPIWNNFGDCGLLGVFGHQKMQGQNFPTIPFKQAPKNINSFPEKSC